MSRKSVVLYSGGLDAFGIDQLFEPDERVFVDVGTEEAEKERSLLMVNGDRHHSVNMEWLSAFEGDDKIIPFRNTFFVLAGACYGDDVLLGATAGDGVDTADTTEEWAQSVQAVLRQYHDGPEETAPSVELPLSEYTKADIVSRLVKAKGLSLRTIHERTKSCHYGSRTAGCGECVGCVRRFVAFACEIDLSDDLSLDDVEAWFQSDIVEFMLENEEFLFGEFAERGREFSQFKFVLDRLRRRA